MCVHVFVILVMSGFENLCVACVHIRHTHTDTHTSHVNPAAVWDLHNKPGQFVSNGMC